MGNRSTDIRRQTADEFIRGLDSVPWFENVGKPHEWDSDVVRMHNPQEEWPGPENPENESLGARMGIWYGLALDDVADAAAREENQRLFQNVYQTVEAMTVRKVPYDPKSDPWYWANAAVCTAAYLSGVIACLLKRNRPIPPEARRVWYWLAEGHWPCQYAEVPRDWDDPAGGGSPGQFVVY